MSTGEFCCTIMLVYISHSSSDFKLFRSLRDLCESKGFTLVREKSFEFGESLTEKGKRRIELANVAVILLTAFGRSSYRVFQETEFIVNSCKDHFVIEGFGNKIEVRKKIAENSRRTNNQVYTSSLDALEKLIHEFSSQLKPDDFNFVYHTDLVY